MDSNDLLMPVQYDENHIAHGPGAGTWGMVEDVIPVFIVV